MTMRRPGCGLALRHGAEPPTQHPDRHLPGWPGGAPAALAARPVAGPLEAGRIDAGLDEDRAAAMPLLPASGQKAVRHRQRLRCQVAGPGAGQQPPGSTVRHEDSMPWRGGRASPGSREDADGGRRPWNQRGASPRRTEGNCPAPDEMPLLQGSRSRRSQPPHASCSTPTGRDCGSGVDGAERGIGTESVRSSRTDGSGSSAPTPRIPTWPRKWSIAPAMIRRSLGACPGRSGPAGKVSRTASEGRSNASPLSLALEIRGESEHRKCLTVTASFHRTSHDCVGSDSGDDHSEVEICIRERFVLQREMPPLLRI